MKDPHTRESRGFGFVKMTTPDEADAAKDGLQGEVYEGRTLSIEKARRARPRTPTPGKYFGPPKRGPPPPRSYDPYCPLYPYYPAGSVQAMLTAQSDDRPPRGYRDRYEVSINSELLLVRIYANSSCRTADMAGATTIVVEEAEEATATGTKIAETAATVPTDVVTSFHAPTATRRVMIVMVESVVKEEDAEVGTAGTIVHPVVLHQSQSPEGTRATHVSLHQRATTRSVAATTRPAPLVRPLA